VAVLTGTATRLEAGVFVSADVPGPLMGAAERVIGRMFPGGSCRR